MLKITYNTYASPKTQKVARFYDLKDAIDFGIKHFCCEISNRSGIIFQSKLGKPTAEFEENYRKFG